MKVKGYFPVIRADRFRFTGSDVCRGGPFPTEQSARDWIWAHESISGPVEVVSLDCRPVDDSVMIGCYRDYMEAWDD